MAIISSQVWGYSSTTVPSYGYDGIESIQIHQNIESEAQNNNYDDTRNLRYCCNTSLNSDSQEKTRAGSFFALDEFFIATKNPLVGGGAKLDNLSPSDITRIQNASQSH